jgi:hypothetical protein
MAKEETIVVAVNAKMRNKDLILHDLNEVVEVDKPDPKDADREKQTTVERTVKIGAKPTKVKKTAFVMAHLRGGDLVHVTNPEESHPDDEVEDQSESHERGKKKPVGDKPAGGALTASAVERDKDAREREKAEKEAREKEAAKGKRG